MQVGRELAVEGEIIVFAAQEGQLRTRKCLARGAV